MCDEVVRDGFETGFGIASACERREERMYACIDECIMKLESTIH